MSIYLTGQQLQLQTYQEHLQRNCRFCSLNNEIPSSDPRFKDLVIRAFRAGHTISVLQLLNNKNLDRVIVGALLIEAVWSGQSMIIEKILALHAQNIDNEDLRNAGISIVSIDWIGGSEYLTTYKTPHGFLGV